MSLMSLLAVWMLIAIECAVSWIACRMVFARVDRIETIRSRQEWRLMCEALELDDFATVLEGGLQPAPTSAVAPTELEAVGASKPVPLARRTRT